MTRQRTSWKEKTKTKKKVGATIKSTSTVQEKKCQGLQKGKEAPTKLGGVRLRSLSLGEENQRKEGKAIHIL